MKRAALLSLLSLLILALASPAMAQEKKKLRIAVGDFFTKGGGENVCRGWPSNYGQTAAASLRSRLAETGAFTVLSREQILKVLKEHEISMTGLGDAENAKATGQFLQADLIVGGDFLCQPNYFEFNVNLIDVEKAEIVWAKVYEMKDVSKMNVTLKNMAKLMADYAKTGSMGKSAGETEDLGMIDTKIMTAASEAVITTIQQALPRVAGVIDDVNVYAEGKSPIKVKISSGGNQWWPGFKLQVKNGEDEVGWIVLKKKAGNFVEADADGEAEVSSFEKGLKASSEEYKPKVAIGYIKDMDEANDKLVEFFKEGLIKAMKEAEKFEPVDDNSVEKILDKMGEKTNKKELEKLFKKGVDLLLTGRFVGPKGERRIDFEALSTFDGKAVFKIRWDSGRIFGKGNGL